MSYNPKVLIHHSTTHVIANLCIRNIKMIFTFIAKEATKNFIRSISSLLEMFNLRPRICIFYIKTNHDEQMQLCAIKKLIKFLLIDLSKSALINQRGKN